MFEHETRIFHPWQLVVMGVCMAMLFCLVASYDIEQAEQDQALYCENVKAKVWPAYDKAIDCDYQDDEKQ